MPSTFDFRFQGVTIYDSVLDHELNDEDGMVGEYVDDISARIVIAAKSQVGVETGRLRETIHKRYDRDARGQGRWIGSEDSIALIHHEGTRPHIILPKNIQNGVLRFSAGGRMISTRMVMHPGTRPNRYLSDNLYLVNV